MGVVGDIWPKWVGVALQIGTEVGSQGQWDLVARCHVRLLLHSFSLNSPSACLEETPEEERHHPDRLGLQREQLEVMGRLCCVLRCDLRDLSVQCWCDDWMPGCDVTGLLGQSGEPAPPPVGAFFFQ